MLFGKSKKSDTQQSEADQILDAVFDATPVMIAYMDKDLNFVRVNRAYASADEKTPGYFVGKNHFDLYPNEENEQIFKNVVETGEAYSANAKAFNYEYAPERGTTHWDWTLSPVKEENGEVVGVVLSLLDVTRHINIESELSYHRENLQNLVDHATSDLKKSLEEKEVLLKEVHHRVKNNLAMVSAFLKLQMKRVDYPDAINALTACDNRIQAMAKVYKTLYQSTDMSSINMKDLIHELIGVFYVPSKHGKLAVLVNIDPLKLEIDIAIPCALIVSELLSNTLKYAFTPEHNGIGEVRIRMYLNENNQCCLDFSDNGCGLPAHVDINKPDSLGLKLIQLYIDQLNGDFSVSTKIGTHWYLSFPGD